jgi:hypothetical protein
MNMFFNLGDGSDEKGSFPVNPLAFGVACTVQFFLFFFYKGAKRRNNNKKDSAKRKENNKLLYIVGNRY